MQASPAPLLHNKWKAHLSSGLTLKTITQNTGYLTSSLELFVFGGLNFK